MRAFFIVVLAPNLHLFARICKAQEPMRVQAFSAETTVEGFDEHIVGGLSRPAEVECDAAPVSPQIQVAGYKLSALVDADICYIRILS